MFRSRLWFIYISPMFILLFAVFNAKSDEEWPRTDFSRLTVDLEEIVSGGPPKDGIPALDNPTFVYPRYANSWLDEREPVIVVEIDGSARAYPLQILIYHEIVNDELNGHPISITFCPLCNASIVFDRRLDGEILDFGTTGKLRKSDLVMYDRQSESWWQQFTGIGIVGKYAGKELKQLPSAIVSYAAFKKQYPKNTHCPKQNQKLFKNLGDVPSIKSFFIFIQF